MLLLGMFGTRWKEHPVQGLPAHPYGSRAVVLAVPTLQCKIERLADQTAAAIGFDGLVRAVDKTIPQKIISPWIVHEVFANLKDFFIDVFLCSLIDVLG